MRAEREMGERVLRQRKGRETTKTARSKREESWGPVGGG